MPRDWVPPGPVGSHSQEQLRVHRQAFDAAVGSWWARIDAANKALAVFDARGQA